MSDNILSQDKIGHDYLSPGERVIIPDHVQEAMRNSQQIVPDELTIEDLPEGINVSSELEVESETFTFEPDSEVTYDIPEEIIEDTTAKEAIIEEPVVAIPEVELSTDIPEEVVIDLSMKEEDHVLEKPSEPKLEKDPDEVYPDEFMEDEEDAPTETTKLQFVPPKHEHHVTWEAKFKDKKTDRIRNPLNELSMLGVNFNEFNTNAENSDDEIEYKTEKDKLWLVYLQEAAKLFHTFKTYDETLNRPGANWEQLIKSEAGPLTLSRPNFKKNGEQELVGEKAVLKLSSAMNLGQMLNVPFWHSGLWLKMKAPSDATLLNLENRIAEEKAMLGRQTNGFVFSNASAYIYDYLTTAILSDVYGGSTDKRDVIELRKLIKITDIPTLVWGYLSTIYPNGYPLAQPCVNSIGKCNHVEHEMIMISKLMWVDKSSLGEGHIAHMTKRDKVMDDEQIFKYQQTLPVGGDKLIKINDTLSIVLAVPSIQDYIDAGYKWVESIERMVAGSFAASKTGDERNEYILKMSATMSLRQYSHWIKEIHFYDDPSDPDTINYIKDKDTLETSMDNLSKDDDVAAKIIEKVAEYIDASTLAVVGIPRYQCPVCNADQGKFLPADRYIIPLDVVRIFFTLQSQRMLKVMYSTN